MRPNSFHSRPYDDAHEHRLATSHMLVRAQVDQEQAHTSGVVMLLEEMLLNSYAHQYCVGAVSMRSFVSVIRTCFVSNQVDKQWWMVISPLQSACSFGDG